MKIRLFLKGAKQSGKTALLIRALSDLRPISGGYVIIDLVNGDEHTPALLEPREAAADHLPMEMFADSLYSKEDFLSGFDCAIADIKQKGLGYIDAVFGDELSDSASCAKLEELLTGEIPVAGVICAAEDAGNANEYGRLLKMLESDENTVIIDTDAVSDSEAIKIMREWAEAVMDKAHHDKFDPQMKMRARRRRPEFPPDYNPDFK